MLSQSPQNTVIWIMTGMVSCFAVVLPNRIIEWFELEGTLKFIHPPCHGHGHLLPDQVAQSPILEYSPEGRIHNYFGQPVPAPCHSHSNEFLQYVAKLLCLCHSKTRTCYFTTANTVLQCAQRSAKELLVTWMYTATCEPYQLWILFLLFGNTFFHKTSCFFGGEMIDLSHESYLLSIYVYVCLCKYSRTGKSGRHSIPSGTWGDSWG